MDPRVARTRASLQEALLELAREHPLDAITVADIAERAGVNRSSFYQHYTDKETLLADALEMIIDDVSTRIGSVSPADIAAPDELTQYLQHIAENANLYRRVLGDHGSALISARLRDRVDGIVRAAMARAMPEPFAGLPVDVIAAAITGSALGVITAWLDRDELAPVEVAAGWLWQVLFGKPDAC
ncbi:TetR/AcrR family transcriptional regulator [Microbacterium sp. NPDC089189]|uniref:TetR/AcrR family transcriptional regulator n=1 Tax=Microbacterium sp. NPDC089189 TaxID=3154972 RepID=UPI00343CE488